MPRLFSSLSVALLCAACGAGGGGTEVASDNDLRTNTPDTSDVLFEPDRLLQVDIEMDPAEYELLRQEGRNFPLVLSGCAANFEYNNYRAQVSVDGQVLDDVDIRKKGFLGSLSASRPSFKLNFDTHQPGRRLESLERMTLNNNRQDPGNTHQCITYKMFRDAGLPAPRCNFARVTMNGSDLGIYSHVESIRKHFLRRNFDSDEGNLYEGQVQADFGEYNKDLFQLKTNRELNDRTDLDAVVNALSATDENLPGTLAQVIDLDQYLTYWAMEGITGHWDSATGNANNYFIYKNPSTDLFQYIPWGADGSMELQNRTGPGTGPLFRYNSIASRLYGITQYRNKYHRRVLELLDLVWNEQALNTEVDRIRDLTGTAEEKMVQVREFIANHEARVRASVAGELEQIERTIVDQETVCDMSNITTIHGSFSSGLGFFEYTDLDGNLISVPAISSSPSEGSPGIQLGEGVSFSLVGNVDGSPIVALVTIEKDEFGSAGEIPFHGVATTLFLIDLGNGGFWFSGKGSITFDEAPEIGVPPTMYFFAELSMASGRGFLPGGGQ